MRVLPLDGLALRAEVLASETGAFADRTYGSVTLDPFAQLVDLEGPLVADNADVPPSIPVHGDLDDDPRI